jgi:hypothetical protein
MSMAAAYGIALDTKKRPPEDVAMCIARADRARQADIPHRQRGIRNLRAFTGINNKQWENQLSAEMIAQGRDPKTYNFQQLFVEGVAGNYVMNATDAKFIDREDDFVDVQEAVAALQNVWYCDKEHGNFTNSRNQCIVNGCIYRGVEEMVIERTSKDPRTWRVKFESVRPDLVTFDPNNLTDDIARGSREYWKDVYLSPWDMLRYTEAREEDVARALYRQTNETLKREAGTYDTFGPEYEFLDIDSFDQVGKTRLGSMFRCTEWGHVEFDRVRYHLHIPSGQRIPETGHRFGGADDRRAKQEWAIAQGFVLTDESVTEIEDWVPVNYLTTYCEDLGLMLCDKPDIRQLVGHVPMYSWSFVQKAGISIGIPDFTYDGQCTLNEREAQKNKLITQAAVKKPWFHPEAFGDNITKKRDYVENANDVSKPVELDAEATPGINYFGQTPGTETNSALFQDESTMIEFMNQIGRLPPAMRGMPGNSAESGIAVGRRVIEGSILQRLPSEYLRQHENYKATDYAIMAPKIYGGAHNYDRRFSNAKGDVSVTINEHAGYDDNDQPIVKKDLSKLKRVEVIITEGKENDYMKQARREMDVATLSVMQPTPVNLPIITAVQCNLARNMDYVDISQKEEVEALTEMTMELTKKKLQLEMLAVDQQLQAAQNPQGQGGMPPMEGGAMEQAGALSGQPPEEGALDVQFGLPQRNVEGRGA